MYATPGKLQSARRGSSSARACRAWAEDGQDHQADSGQGQHVHMLALPLFRRLSDDGLGRERGLLAKRP